MAESEGHRAGLDTSKFVNTTGLKIPRKYLSISQVSSYLLCPRSYYWKYVEGKRELASPNMVAGIAGHKLLEIMGTFENMDFDQNVLSSKFNDIFGDLKEEVPPNQRTKEFIEEVDTLKDRLFPSVAKYCIDNLQDKSILAREVQVHENVNIFVPDTAAGETKWENTGKITFLGFVDFIKARKKTVKKPEGMNIVFDKEKFKGIADKVSLGDYKTGGEKDHTYFMTDAQLPFYSYCTGIRHTRVDNILMSRIKFNKNGAPRKDNIPPSYKILEYGVEEADIQKTLRQLSDAAIGIGSGSFPECHPTSWKCSPNNCGHWSYCRGSVGEKVYLEKVASKKVIA